MRGKTKVKICACGVEYEARVADLKRGWGKSCSKSCAAIRKMKKNPRAFDKYMHSESRRY